MLYSMWYHKIYKIFCRFKEQSWCRQGVIKQNINLWSKKTMQFSSKVSLVWYYSGLPVWTMWVHLYRDCFQCQMTETIHGLIQPLQMLVNESPDAEPVGSILSDLNIFWFGYPLITVANANGSRKQYSSNIKEQL